MSAYFQENPRPGVPPLWTGFFVPLFLLPMKVGPQIGRACAASLADEQRLKIGQLDIIRPLIGADPSPMAALVVRAVDQQAANAHLAHFTESYFLRAVHQSASLAWTVCGRLGIFDL